MSTTRRREPIGSLTSSSSGPAASSVSHRRPPRRGRQGRLDRPWPGARRPGSPPSATVFGAAAADWPIIEVDAHDSDGLRALAARTASSRRR